MVAKQKTWKQLETELAESMRKWGVSDYMMTSPFAGKYARRVTIEPEERAVTLTFTKWRRGTARTVTLIMRMHLRAFENLEAICKAVEHLRMAEYREIDKLVMLAYRQLDPAEPRQMPPPPGPSSPKISEHYRRLGVLPSAPLAVAEAAYKALARQAHPDAGGSTIDMQQLNAAIEQIRKEKVK